MSDIFVVMQTRIPPFKMTNIQIALFISLLLFTNVKVPIFY